LDTLNLAAAVHLWLYNLRNWYYAFTVIVGYKAAAMDKSDLLRYKNLLLSKRQELSTDKSLVDSISTAGELRGDRSHGHR